LRLSGGKPSTERRLVVSMKPLSQPGRRFLDAEDRLMNSRQLTFVEREAQALDSDADIFERRWRVGISDSIFRHFAPLRRHAHIDAFKRL
jgi:hypothetical protein